MAHVSVRKITKVYAGKPAVRAVAFEVESGTFLTLLGPSGCGKTTTLNIIAGFLLPDQGQVLIDARDVTNLPPYVRDTSMVFQSYALFPHMRVFDNVAFGLRAHRVPSPEVRTRVVEMLTLLGLQDLAQRYPRQLSGGQQQRVAVARSLVVRPSVLLMDEPLSNLDAKLRQEIRVELRNLQQRLNLTVIFVTHDQEEAFAVSDRVIVMRDGSVVQEGTPQELYEQPKSRFVADFVGFNNIFTGQPVAEGFATSDGLLLQTSGLAIRRGDALGVRAAMLELAPADFRGDDPREIVLYGTIASQLYLGAATRFLVSLDGRAHQVVVDEASGRSTLAKRVGDRVSVRVPVRHLVLFRDEGEPETASDHEGQAPERASAAG